MKKMLAGLLALWFAMLCVGAVAEVAPAATPDIVEAEDDVDDWLFEEDSEWDDLEEYDESIFDDIDDEGYEEDVEDEVESELLGAMEIYSYFVMQPLDVDLDKPDSTGTRYQVLDERFNTMALWRDYVSSEFSDEIVDDLFAMGVYVEENGYLYTTTDGRNIDENLGETEFTLTSETADEKVYTVTASYWGPEEEAEEQFTYVQKLIDGEWKFTEFPFFW